MTLPVYLITVHTYRSWQEDNPLGYVQRGKVGVQRPNPKLAGYRQGSANADEVRLTDHQIIMTLDAVREVCINLGVTPYAGSCTPTHWHLLAGWEDPVGVDVLDTMKQSPRSLATRLKRVVGSKLSADAGQTGLRWFSRGWHIERVERQKHFDHLVESYLPKHVSEGGQYVFWKSD